jgi:hypothetical protein
VEVKQRFQILLTVYFISLISLTAQEDPRKEYKYLSDTNKTGLIDLKSDPEIQRIANLKANLIPSLQKLSTDLLQLINPEFLPRATSLEHHAETMKSLKQFKSYEQTSNFEESIAEGVVYIYVYLKKGISTSVINYFVEQVTDRDEKNNLAVAWVKVKNLSGLASLEEVRTIQTVMPPVFRTGSVNTEGDAVHRTSNVRSTYGEDGTGINVGIISDGVTTKVAAQASGDLPPDGMGLTVLDAGNGDEGTAMLEIVHDMVPEANLFFHSSGGSTVAFNSAIDDLIAAGCDIICDDVGWITQPFYEDGIVASHINSAIAANDIIYVSSCGNAGLTHYQGDFFPLASDPTQHDFSAGTTATPYLYIPLTTLQNVRIVLQWDDDFGSSGNDYDLYLYNFGTSTFVAASENVQSGTQDPLEFINYTRPVGGPAIYDYAIIVVQFIGSPVNLEVYIYASTSNYSNNRTPVDAIFGHPAVDNVVSVAAAFWNTPNSIESFSSQGPSTIVYPSLEFRMTPKITGVDGVSVTGAGGFPSTFLGTSAAAPHIAAILAQAWSFDLGQTGDDVRQLLYDWPVDLGGVGLDNIFGYGRADALNIFDGALPVELSSFTAKVLRSGGVKLDWRTETEVSNYGFEVHRADLNLQSEIQNPQFEMVGFVQGFGNSNSPKDYSFIDNDASYGKYSYRLKQIDTDGSHEYSKVIEVDAGNIPSEIVLEQNYPNPFNPSTKIKFAVAETQTAKLIVYDVLGNEVAVPFNGTAEGGKLYESVFDGSSLSSGIYFYRLEIENKVENRKMLLLK